jgi:hypothetical protein
MTRNVVARIALVALTGATALLSSSDALGASGAMRAGSPRLRPLISSRAGPGRLVALESSTPVVNVLYRYGQASGVAADGAYGANLRAPASAWFLEEQRAGAVDLYDGVLRDDPGLIAEGQHIFRYGLARQAANGSFPGSAWPFHGTALFLAEAAPSLIFLQQSKYAAQFALEIRWDIDRMQRAAYYMVRDVGGPGQIDDTTKNHRRFEAALALGATGILAGDRTLISWSHLYARQGVQMQWVSGIMPENGGHDSGYQSVGLSYAIRYLALVARGSLRGELVDAVSKGEAWELSRVRADGSIDQSGDRRTVNCEERSPNGECKSVFAIPIAAALARWSALSGSERYAAAADSVWARATGSKPPPA